jgi:hypothetical protein
MYDEAIREYDELKELKELSRCRHVLHYDIATVRTALGDKEQALASLELC